MFSLPPFIFTSHVSDRGYKNGTVCLCVCVCVCQFVNTLTTERINVQWCTVTKSDTGIYLDKIPDEFAGQGERSKVKGQGRQVKKRDVYDFLVSVPVYNMLAYCVTLWSNVMSWYDVMTSGYDVMTSQHDIISACRRCSNTLVFFSLWFKSVLWLFKKNKRKHLGTNIS